MTEKIGALIFAIGAMAGDSENLLIPIAIMITGILIIRKGNIYGINKNRTSDKTNR